MTETPPENWRWPTSRPAVVWPRLCFRSGTGTYRGQAAPEAQMRKPETDFKVNQTPRRHSHPIAILAPVLIVEVFMIPKPSRRVIH